MLIEDKDSLLDTLANIRDVLLPLVNAKDNQCGDMVSCTVSNPACIECLAKQIAKQHEGLKGEVERLKGDVRFWNETWEQERDLANGQKANLHQRVERYRTALERSKHVLENVREDMAIPSALITISKALEESR